ncbi:MAG: tetratricopeptide repeat protein [Enterobacterales bacterium]|nr:tetratricopeptide repeat protein [Enterobacterales bacterium]
MEFETEEQQVEAIKKWFSEYGITIILGLVIGLGGVFGYRAYEDHNEVQLQLASADYQEIIAAQVATPDKAAFDNVVAEFKRVHGASIYTNLLDLQVAKIAVEAKDLAAAENALMAVINAPEHVTIEHSARLRLARVLIAQQKYEEALTLISDLGDNAYEYNYEMLRGDIWLARGDDNRAKTAYEKAKAVALDTPPHPDLDMVLTELATVGTSNKAEVSSGDEND